MQVSNIPLPPRRSKGDRILSILARCQAEPRWPDLLIALILCAPVPLAMAAMSHVLVNYTLHDVFIPLDAAWRSLSGQWPHSDYYTPLGLSYTATHGAAARLWGMDARVVDRANLVALPLVLVPALLLSWRRLNVLAMVLLCVLLAVLVASPVFIDGPERVIAHLANYNRWGGGLCAAVCLWALCPPSRASRGLDAAEAAVLAVAFVFLFHLKLTFFALAGVTTLAGLVTGALPWRRAVPVAGLAALGLVVLELLHPGLLLAYAGDIRRAGAANTQLFRGFYTAQAVVANLLPCALIGGLGAVVAWLAPDAGPGGERRRVGGILVVACACVLVATQNFGAFSAPLVVLVLLLAQRLGRAGAGLPALATRHDAGPALGVLGLAAAVLATTPFLLTHLSGTAYLLSLRPAKGVAVGDVRPADLAPLVWLPNPIERTFMPADFTVDEARRWQVVLPPDVAATVLQDGFDLLAREGLTRMRIANLAFSNPFPVAFRAPPPRGVGLWWDENRTFTTDRLTPEQALGDAQVVMVPRVWWQLQITVALLGVAQPRLTRDYVPHESRYWTAWVRNPA